MKLEILVEALENWAPAYLAEPYDNPGLLVGIPNLELTGALINLDMTLPVIQEAKEQRANLVIAHHPIWFGARKRLTGEDYVSRAIMYAVKHDIALYAIHTNLDNIQSGVNKKISDKLGLTKVEFLAPKKENPDAGSGMVGFLPEPLPKAAFLEKVQAAFRSPCLRYADFPGETISKVAVCGGSGSFLTRQALDANCDALVTADITYHKFFDNEGQMLLVDTGHYESEQYTSELLFDFISQKFPKFAVRLSETYTNPVKYFS